MNARYASPAARLPRLAAGLALVLSLAACTPSLAPGVLPADLERYELIPEADARCEGFVASRGQSQTADYFASPTLEEQLAEAEIAVLANIEAVLPARYATSSGAPPDDPEADRVIHRPIVLRIVERLKGPDDLVGLVVSRGGGCDRRASYQFEDDPVVLTGDVGDQGILFASLRPEWADDPPVWFEHLQHATSVRTSAAARYAPVTSSNWYRAEDGLAVSAIDWAHEPVPFEAAMERLLEQER